MAFQYKTQTPVFGTNYNTGYIGFTWRREDFISDGIAYFTGWDRIGDIKVSHALIVSGDNRCIEARADTDKVAETPIDAYFKDTRCLVFFRKPLGWTEDIGSSIAATAATQIGCRYNFSLLLADAIRGSFLGRIIDKTDSLNRFFDTHGTWICSELAAYAMDQQPQYHDKGILKKPDDTITPQELFQDETIFEPWKSGAPALANDSSAAK